MKPIWVVYGSDLSQHRRSFIIPHSDSGLIRNNSLLWHVEFFTHIRVDTNAHSGVHGGY